MKEIVQDWPQKVLLANPRGFCAGVVRAVEALNTAVQQSQKPIYSYHEIIHNTHIVEGFKNGGVSFVNSIDDVPDGANLFISAHGVQPQIVQQAEQKEFARNLDSLERIDAIIKNEVDSLINKAEERSKKLAQNQS